LRAVQTRSPLVEFEQGSFHRVLGDTAVESSKVTRVVLASGKVAHEAIVRRNELGIDTVAIVRVEQLYPWPAEAIEAELAKYPNADEVVWLQEEPENMGAWPFVHLRTIDWQQWKVRHVARAESASPATGSGLVHAAEQADLFVRALQ
jgi:2-oxoglutarate dehydrogenase E1 component